MFWTDWGDKSKIERCGMNGDPKSRQIIVDKNIGWPNGLTIDYTLNRIWWTDAKPGLDTIESADLNGNHRRIVLKSGSLEHPFGISVFQDNMYWTDWQSRKFFRANKFTGGEEVALAVNLPSVMNVAVFQQQRQPLGSFIFYNRLEHMSRAHWSRAVMLESTDHRSEVTCNATIAWKL